jgi:spermidine synthase
VALFLTFLTGVSGLVYEITWEKALATLLGSHAEATAAVLALFLGGMSLGYWLWGVMTSRLAAAVAKSSSGVSLLRAYGWLEASIGLWALAFPLLFAGVQWLSGLLPGGGGALAFAIDIALSALLIGPPAVMMGGTIPMLTQALARSLGDATRVHALIYATNTTGAFVGALSAGFWIVPALGLVGALRAMAVVNLVAGAVFIGLARRAGASPPASQLPEPAPAATPASFAAIACLAGFAMMTLQTVIVRMGALAFGASQFSFSMVVACFVLCIALGSYAVSALGERIPRSLLPVDLWLLFGMLALLFTQLDAAPYWAHALRALFRDERAAFYPYSLSAFGLVLAAIGPAVLLSGTVLPLIFHALRREAGDLGDVAGRLYSWNTIGSLLGALLGGYALLYWFSLETVMRIALAGIAVAAAISTLYALPVARARSAAAAGLAIACAVIAALPSWDTGRLAAGLFRHRAPMAHSFEGPEKFFASQRRPLELFYEDDPVASIAVQEYGEKGGRPDRAVVSNGKSDGTTYADYPTMALAGLLPALFAEQNRSSFVIGYGLGVTVGELAALPEMQRVRVAEISRGVIRAARFFDYANLGASQRPSVEMLQEDAYRSLIRSDEHFDVIASEPSNPWMLGVEQLFSREFLSVARDHLTAGGVYAQWMHTYEIDQASVALVLRTYAEVFSDVAVWYAGGPDLILLGFRDASRALDVERLRARSALPAFAAGLERSRVQSFPALLAHELLPLGVLHAAALEGEVQTLLHPRLNFLAARAFFVGREAELPPMLTARAAEVGRANSLLRRYAQSRGGTLPDSELAETARELCRQRPRECVTLLAEWAARSPQSDARNAVVKELSRDPIVAATTPFREVLALIPLFAPDPSTPEPDDRKALELARKSSDRFADFYYHAAPFSRDALARLWQRCEQALGASGDCLAGRAAVQRVTGRLPNPVPAR